MKDKRNVGQVETETNLLGESSGTVTLAINLKPSNNGEAVESDTLVIHAFKGSKLKHQYMFRLEKAWDVSGAGSGSGGQGSVVSLVNIKPIKEGGAPVTYQLMKMEMYSQSLVVQQNANLQQNANIQTPRQNAYLIKARQNQNVCIHKQQGNWNNGNPLHLWRCDKGKDSFKNWQWDSRTGYIRSKTNRNKCIVKKNGNWNNGNVLVLGDCNAGSVNLKSWDYEESSGLIRARKNRNKCIHKKLNSWADGNPLHLWDCSAGNSQMKSWKMRPMSGTVAELPPAPTGPVSQTEPEDKTPRGPGEDANFIDEFQGQGISDENFLGISVKSDLNPASGVFYYVPSYYSLAWDASAGRHTIEVTYEPTVAGAESDDSVRMKMTLHASSTTKRRQLVEKILDKLYPEFTDLIKLSGVTQVDLSERLQLYDVEEDNIATSSVGDELNVEWITDSVSQETLAVSLAGQGLRGDVTITPQNEDKVPVSVPVHAALASERTFGHINWDRQEGWKNSTDYPVILKKMHAIKMQANSLRVDTWDLGSKEVPAGAKVVWDASEVPANLHSQSEYVWFDYSVPECQSCAETAIARIIQDIVQVPKKTLNVKVLSPIGDCSLGGAILRIRSRHLRPNQNTMESVEIDLQDDGRYEQELFSSTQQSGPPKAEYQLNVYLPSGELLTTESWNPINGLNLPIGSFQLSQFFGDRITCE
jgi:hypothetical protein